MAYNKKCIKCNAEKAEKQKNILLNKRDSVYLMQYLEIKIQWKVII